MLNSLFTHPTCEGIFGDSCQHLKPSRGESVPDLAPLNNAPELVINEIVVCLLDSNLYRQVYLISPVPTGLHEPEDHLLESIPVLLGCAVLSLSVSYNVSIILSKTANHDTTALNAPVPSSTVEILSRLLPLNSPIRGA